MRMENAMINTSGDSRANSPQRDPAFTCLAIIALQISLDVFRNQSEHCGDCENPLQTNDWAPHARSAKNSETDDHFRRCG